MTDGLYDSNPLRAALRACKRHFLFAGLFSGLINILYLVPSIFMLQVYDRVVPTRGVLTLVFITLVILGALATLSVLDQMRNAILLRAAIRLDDEIGPRLVRMTVSTPAAGGHPQQVMRDFDTLRQFLASPALGALFDMPWAPIYIIVATIIHPLLGLATLIGAAILVALAIANDRATRAAAKAAAERSTDTYFAQEAVGSVTDTIRALGMRDALVNQFVASRVQSAAPGRAVPGRYLELARRKVGVRTGDVGFDGFESRKNPVAQRAEPSLSCGLLGRDVVWECHGVSEMNRHLSAVNPSACVFPLAVWTTRPVAR